MADIDSDLANRLSRLAGAVPVPVGPGQLDPVHRSAVAARQSVRLAWITPLVVLVIGGLLVGLTKLGPIAPGASAVAGPIAATDIRGAFSLTIRSAKAVYRPDEPIDVAASLVFAGPDPSIEISHGLGVNEGPLGFGVVEPVDVPGVGLIQLGGGYRLACRTSTFQRDAPIEAPYSKGGSPLLDPPEGPTFEQLQAYMSDPVLRLPVGTWHIFAVAEFSTGDCAPGVAESEQYHLRTEIVIVVDDDPTATPGPPQPTRFLNKPVYGGDDIGDFTMQLMAGHSTYAAGAPIDVSAWYTFGSGLGNSITVSHFQPEMAFSISQVDDAAQVIRQAVYDSDCQELTLADGQEKRVALADDTVTEIRAVSWPPSSAKALKDGVLQLPAGRWRITAVVQTTIGPCGQPGEARQLHASIEIDVVDAMPGETETPSAATPSLPVPTDWADPPVYGEDDDGLAVLQLRSSHASYAEGTPIELEAKYWFADGPALVASHYPPELLLSITQLDAINPTGRGASYDGACTELGRVDGTKRRVVLTGSNIAFIRGDRVPTRLEDLFVGGALVLSVGRWEINANVEGRFAPCGRAGDGYALSASIVIEVVPG